MFKKNNIDTEGINEIIILSKRILKLLFIILFIGIILASIVLLKELGIFKFLNNILKVLTPLFIGFIVAWLFSPLVDRLTKKGIPRIISSIIVYIIFILFLIIFFRIFIPVIYHEINELIGTLPSIIDKITKFIKNIDIDGINIEGIKKNLLLEINKYSNNITKDFPTTTINIMSSLASGIGTIFFGLIIGLYMLFDFDNVSNLLLKVIPVKYKVDIASLIERIGQEVRKCVNGTLLIACMVFVCDTVGFSIVGLKSALLFGLFCGITDLIPYIGPYIGTIVATVVGFTQNAFTGIIVFIIAVVVQLIESYVLQPVVMSKATNLHPIVIICGLLIFGKFFGILGMILATPIMSIMKVIIEFIIEKTKINKKVIDEV